MTKEEFNNLYKPNMMQALTYIDPITGYRERAIFTSGLLTSFKGNEFVSLTRHRKSFVNLRDIETIKDLNVSW
jgi:hypothetical protein